MKTVLVLVFVVLDTLLQVDLVQLTDEEDHLYHYVQASMSRQAFKAIREKNQTERKEFGDGRHAPYWPTRKSNGYYSLRRGVWVDNSAPRQPTNAELDEVRERHRERMKVITSILVNGQRVPCPCGDLC